MAYLLIGRHGSLRKQSITIRKIRLLQLVPRTRGSISMETHALKMAVDLGRPPTVDELFVRTHKRKVDGMWVDKKAETIFADYREQAGHAELLASQSGTSLTQSERVKLWKNTTGVRSKKNRVYSHPLDSDNSDFEGPSSKGSSSQANEQLKDLNEKVDGLLGLHKTVEGMQVMLGRIAEHLDVNRAEV